MRLSLYDTGQFCVRAATGLMVGLAKRRSVLPLWQAGGPLPAKQPHQSDQ